MIIQRVTVVVFFSSYHLCDMSTNADTTFLNKTKQSLTTTTGTTTATTTTTTTTNETTKQQQKCLTQQTSEKQ